MDAETPDGTLHIDRGMVIEAIDKLTNKGYLNVEDVFWIAYENGAKTDRLMTVLCELPNVTFDRIPLERLFITSQLGNAD